MLSLVDINTFYGNIQALKGVSLEVEEGEIITLIGANGAGKTTTLMSISGIVPPRSGKIRFMGKTITRMNPNKIVSMGLCQVPEGRRIFPYLTVMENLDMGAFLRDDKDEIKSDLDYVFDLFPILAERRNQAGGTLSGGEQQMLAIGRALMAQPKILLLDEPLLGLSPLMQAMLMRTTREIRDQRKISIIVTEQYARPVFPIVDYAFILENGSAVLEGTREDLMDNPDVRAAYFGV